MSEADRLAGVVELSAWIAERGDDDEPVGARRDASRRPGVAPDIMPSDEPSGDGPPGEPEAPDADAARHIALRSLGRRAASRFELDRVLSRRGVERDVRDEVLDRLEADGLVDDARLAQDAAERLRERKAMGQRGVAAALRQRGLDPDDAAPADPDEELERAVEAATERRRRMGSLDDETAERRLAGWLQRRGFSGGVVRIAIERSRPRGPRFR